MHTPSRRSVLRSGAALAAILAAPARLRAATKEIVIGGPAGAAKYFNADLFPVPPPQEIVTVFFDTHPLPCAPSRYTTAKQVGFGDPEVILYR